MEFNILGRILLTQLLILALIGATPMFNEVTGYNCWVPSSSTRAISVASKLLCSIKCSIYGVDSFDFENNVCRTTEVPVAGDGTTVYRHYGAETEKEIARNKPTSSSPPLRQLVSKKIVDGDKTTFFHSNGSDYPWVYVDLTGGHKVSKVRLFPRYYPNKAHYLMEFQVLLGGEVPSSPGNFSEFTRVATVETRVPNNTWMNFDVVPPKCSRYVAIYKYEPRTLYENLIEIAELEVYTVY